MWFFSKWISGVMGLEKVIKKPKNGRFVNCLFILINSILFIQMQKKSIHKLKLPNWTTNLSYVYVLLSWSHFNSTLMTFHSKVLTYSSSYNSTPIRNFSLGRHGLLVINFLPDQIFSSLFFSKQKLILQFQIFQIELKVHLRTNMYLSINFCGTCMSCCSDHISCQY